MLYLKNCTFALVGAALLTLIGIYIAGYAAAIVMPVALASYIWVWNVFVIQFLGFGILAILISFSLSGFLKLDFWFSVIVTLLFYQGLLIFIDANSKGIHFSNIVVVLSCLVAGWYLGRKFASGKIRKQD